MNRHARGAEGSDVERIEHDLSGTRARLGATIDALRRRLAPGEVADRAIAYAKGSGGGAAGPPGIPCTGGQLNLSPPGPW
jgi:hypothetical protein